MAVLYWIYAILILFFVVGIYGLLFYSFLDYFRACREFKHQKSKYIEEKTISTAFPEFKEKQ